MAIARLPILHQQFSEKYMIAIMFCDAIKTLIMGIPLINTSYGNHNQDMSGIFSLPLIIYHVEQLIISVTEVIILKNWVNKAIKKQTSVLNNNINMQSEKTDDPEVPQTETVDVKRQ